jgi:hypothetical protein
MVIQKFNKLIRNKWLWGVFAVIVGGAFAFDFLVDDLLRDGKTERIQSDAGTLAGEPVDREEFLSIAEDVRGIGRQRDWQRKRGEVNREAWENYAALKVAGMQGIVASDADVQAAIRRDPSFQSNGSFSFARYQALLRENGITPERFEAFLKRRMTLQRIGQAVLGSAAWTSPMELDQALSDMTDTFTVKVARFSQDKKDADAVKVDDAALKAWYDKNVKTLALPERVKVRYVKFDATDPKVLAKMNVTTNAMHDLYDTTIDKYTSTDTNGVEHVKKFEEVQGEIEKELRRIEAVQYFETNLNFRVYAATPSGASRLDEIAKEDGLKVQTSDWFSVDGSFQEGFMTHASRVCPGANGFKEAVAELDPATEDLRYAVVSSERSVWLVEKAETSAAHTPSFEEAKEAIRGRALRDAKADAFKAKVEAVAKGGVKAVEAVKGCTTNITFCVADIRQGEGASFDDQYSVARAVAKLKKGEVSEFTPTGTGKAILVVCVDRVPGDAAKAMVLRSQIRDEIAMLQAQQIPASWKKWNLERLGFVEGDVSSTEDAEAEE